MASDQFRHELSQEAALWQAEGLISPTQYKLLAERYQFQSLASSARDRFVMILIGVGSILLGLGVITFVAANWQVWPREVKLGLLLSLFLAVNLAGYHLWRQPRSKQRRLGQGLLLLGALILGANLALMTQLFHIAGSPQAFFFLWGFGVLLMAYGLQLASLSVLSLLLIIVGYLQGAFGLAAPAAFSWQCLIVEHMAVIATVLFIPLAYCCRLPALFGLTAVLVITAIEINLSVFAGSFSSVPGWVALLGCLLPPALLWTYEDTLWPGIHSRRFRPWARDLAVLFLSLLLYVFSFHQVWKGQSAWSLPSLTSPPWGLLLDSAILSGLALYQGWRWLIRRREISGSDGLIASITAIAALGLGWHFGIAPLVFLGPVVFNGLLFLLASSLVYDGIATGQRQTFWAGMVLLTLQILSRLLEFETGLLLKSLVFSFCGLAVILAGLWFERHLSNVKVEESP